MKLVKARTRFDVQINNEVKKIKKNSMYILPDQIVAEMQKRNKKTFERAFKVDEITEKIKFFNVLNDSNKHVILIRSGGIGDLIALTSICKRIHEITRKKVLFITQEKYKDLFKFFPDYIKPIFFFENLKIKPELLKNYRVVFFEGVIEKSKENWYEIQYKQINSEFLPEYGRPQLDLEKIKMIKSSYKNKYFKENKINVILNPKSTSIIRSMPVELMYYAVKEYFGDKANILIHEVNMKNPDKSFVKNNNDITVIPKSSLYEYLSDIVVADFILSVDSAAVHLREGAEGKGLGIYASFPTFARTKYYKYMHTIDLKTKCEHQPCFIHTKRPLETCAIAYNLKDYPDDYLKSYSPCHTQYYTSNIKEQILKGIEEANRTTHKQI